MMKLVAVVNMIKPCLVVAIWILDVSILSSAHQLEYKGTGCDGQTFVFSCPRGYFMSLTSGFYGRRDSTTCVDRGVDAGSLDLQCSLASAKDVMSRKCRNKDSCELAIGNETFGDPCPGNSKYMEVEFVCTEPNYSGLQCEGNKISLECPETFFINPAMTVMYGRQDDFTCSHDSAILSTNCTSDTAMDTIVTLCGAKKRCDLYVEASLLGDPCPNTYKYLEVGFSCSACRNDHGSDADCDRWASDGECQKNFDWMQGFCRKSCHGCDWKGACKNIEIDLKCNYWASVGDCVSKAAAMSKNCPLSCNQCLSPGQNATATTTTATPPPPPSRTCAITHSEPSECGVWADIGECQANENWMAKNCHGYCATECSDVCRRKYDYGGCSAGGGTTAVPLLCSNRHGNDTECDGWAKDNECVDNSVFMLRKCAKSCKACFTVRDPCTDLYANATECQIWKTQGECERNPGYMLIMCRVACNNCPLSQTPTSTRFPTIPTTTKTDACDNVETDLKCDFWASTGECTSNPNYMTEKCPKSCNRCPQTGTMTTLPPTTTTLAPTTVTTAYIPENVQNGIACEGKELPLSCSGNSSLRIYSATFGRTDNSTCTDGREDGFELTDCYGDSKVLEKIRKLCNGRRSCVPAAYSDALGDPCPGTFKYLEINYRCEVCGNIYGDDAQCKYWKGRNECALNLIWMHINCYKTCSNCQYADCGNVLGEDETCDYWALREECDSNTVWMETNCRQACRDCPTQEYNCATNCSNHGLCIANNTCACDSGYSGATCTDFRCDGVDNCGSHGTCVRPNVCQCNSGWTGVKCNEFSCGNVSDCSGKGLCVGPDQCLCHPYWSGPDCTDCFVGFQSGPSCLPCPDCVHGTCDQSSAIASTSYKGCYKDDLSFDTKLTSETVNTFLCVQTCQTHGYQYAGTTVGNICACGHRIGNLTLSTGCDLKCAGGQDREICGGRLSMSLWQVYEGICNCDGPNGSGPLCNVCSPGHAGPSCVLITTSTVPTTLPPTSSTVVTASTSTAAPGSTPAVVTASTAATTASTPVVTPAPSSTPSISSTATTQTGASTTTTAGATLPSSTASTLATSPGASVPSSSIAPAVGSTSLRSTVATAGGTTASAMTTAPTPATPPAATPSPAPSTTTEKPTRSEISVNDIKMMVVLQKEWKEIYSNTENAETKQFILWLSDKLTQFYASSLPGVSIEGVLVQQLRSGSVMVDHMILVGQNTTNNQKKDIQCQILQRLTKQDGVIAQGLKGSAESELVKNCAIQEEYCLHKAKLDFDKYGYWICHCQDNYTGPRCENTLQDTIILVVIIVVCLLVPLLVLLIICCILQRKCYKNRFSPDTMNSTSTRDLVNGNGTARSFEFHSMQKGAMSRARKISSKKLFQDTNSTISGHEEEDYFTQKI